MNIEEHTIMVIEQFSGKLPTEFIEECRALARHNEWGIALENLCVQLCEYDVLPSVQELDEIRRLAGRVGIKEESLNFLVSPGSNNS